MLNQRPQLKYKIMSKSQVKHDGKTKTKLRFRFLNKWNVKKKNFSTNIF